MRFRDFFWKLRYGLGFRVLKGDMRSEEGTTIGGSHSDCHSPYSPFGTSKVKGSGSRFLQQTFPLRFMYMPDEESYRRLGTGFLGLELGAYLDLCLQKKLWHALGTTRFSGPGTCQRERV